MNLFSPMDKASAGDPGEAQGQDPTPRLKVRSGAQPFPENLNTIFFHKILTGLEGPKMFLINFP